MFARASNGVSQRDHLETFSAKFGLLFYTIFNFDISEKSVFMPNFRKILRKISSLKFSKLLITKFLKGIYENFAEKL